MAVGSGRESIMAKNSEFRRYASTLLAIFLCLAPLGADPGEAEDTPAVENGPTIPGEYPAVDLSFPETALYRHYLEQYTTPEGLKYLSRVMQNSVQYRQFMLSELDRLEAPRWLIYLPVIESGFTARARSRSGAVGVWQFMRNSVGGYNIRINEWIDERRDPWITTTAAIRKLKDNFRMLNDWPLALAAYNCGLGATRSAMKKAGTQNYWDLCERGFFRRETVHYVPKLFAIAHILSRSAEYGIDWGVPVAEDAYTTIPVSRPVDMNVLSKETGMDTALLSSLNPSLHYSITPPGLSYNLRIPSEKSDDVAALLADRSRILLEYYLYTIKSGDTLFALSLHYGVSVDMLLEYNPGISPRTLQLGKKLVIPAIKEVTTYAGKKDRENLNFSGSYLVKQGDTLWSIALAHGIQVETLAERNNLTVNSILKLGKQLRVPIL